MNASVNRNKLGYTIRGGVIVMAATVLLLLTAAAAEPRIEEAEAWLKVKENAYRVPNASGKEAVVLAHVPSEEATQTRREVPGTIEIRPVLPAGVYVVKVYLAARPVELLHTMDVTVNVGDATRHVNMAWFDASVTWLPVEIAVNHPGGELPVTFRASLTSGFDGMRGTQSTAEKQMLQRLVDEAADGKLGLADDDKPADLGLDLDDDGILSQLEGTRMLSSINAYDLLVLLDKVSFERVAELPAQVTRLWVEKIHYLPGETINVEVSAAAVTQPGRYQLTVHEVWELAEHTVRYQKSVELGLEPTTVSFSFPAEPPEFGRQLLATLTLPESRVPPLTPASLAAPRRHFPGSREECFGISRNVYRIGITGSTIGQSTQYDTRERSQRIMAENKANYANYFERFAWAPCDYSYLAPEYELFWAGQTQYPGSVTGQRTEIEEAHKVGIKAITYGKNMAAAIEGVKTFRRHPEFFGHSASGGVSTQCMRVFLLERMLANDYKIGVPPIEGGWRDWINLVCNWHDNPATVDHGADAIIESVRMFGWDGVRWDGHFDGSMARFKARVNAAFPDFVHGYNNVPWDPEAVTFVPALPVDDFLEVCRDHGLLMDEGARGFSHTNWAYGRPHEFYTAIAREADYIKRAGGLPLYIVFDMASQHDLIYNVLMGLAAGERYTYITSPGEWPYGNLTRFLTRYSAFVWDDTKRVADPRRVLDLRTSDDVDEGDSSYPLLWESSCWVRDIAVDRKQLLVNVINPPRYPAFCDRYQAPARTRRNVTFSLAVPEGCVVSAELHLSPDLAGGHEPLTSQQVDGRCEVVVPAVRTWSIVVFELRTTNGAAFTTDPLPLTTPIEAANEALADIELARETKRKQLQDTVTRGLRARELTPMDDERRVNYDLVVNLDAEDEGKPEMVKEFDEELERPRDLVLHRNGELDVHHARGVFSWLNAVDAAIGLRGGGRRTVSWQDRHYDSGVRWELDEFPATYPELFAHDVVILDNVHAADIGLARRIMIKDFVQQGGGLLIFGGTFNLSRGLDHNSHLADLMPIRIEGYDRWAMDVEHGFALKPEPAMEDRFSPRIDWDTAPSAMYVDTSPLKPGADIWLRAGEHPAIVAGQYGKGRVVVVLMNQHGEPAGDFEPYWQWRHWPDVVAGCIGWLAQGADERVEISDQARQLDPKAPDPQALLMEAAYLEGDELTKRLAAATVNVIDRQTASALLECIVEYQRKIVEPEVLFAVTDAVSPYLDATFAPLADRLVDSELPPLRAIACRLIGLAQNRQHLPVLERGLSHDDQLVRREAVLALGRVGDPRAIPLLLAWAEQEDQEFRSLAATLLLQQKVPDAIRLALPLYGAQLERVRDLKSGHMSMVKNLFGGTSFKLTLKQRKTLTREFEQLKRVERWAREDAARFERLVPHLTGPQADAAIALLAVTERRELVPLAYQLVGRADKDTARGYREQLRGAALPELRLLGAD